MMEDTPISPPGPGLDRLDREQRQGLSQLADSANEKLFKAGADGAEHSFGLGCLVFGLPVAALVAVLFIFGVFNLILSLIVLFMGAVVVAGLVTLMAYNARARAIRLAYEQEIAPEIHRYLSAHNASRSQFDQVAAQVLSEGAPLRRYLDPALAGLIPPTEEE